MPENISGVQLTVAKLQSIFKQLTFFIMKQCIIFNHRIFYGDNKSHIFMFINPIQIKQYYFNPNLKTSYSIFQRKIIQVIPKFDLEITWLF